MLSSVTTNGATTVASQQVQWDGVGLPSQVTTTQSNSTKTVLYGYDSLGQVTSQCSPSSGVVCKSSSPKVTYTYDQNGNRTGETSGSTSTVHTYDVDDRLVTSTAGSSVTSYSYGLNGDLDSVTSPAGTVQYAYGLDGNLYNAVLADGRAVALAYDESGNRVQRNVNGVMTAKWVWDTNAALPVRTNESGASTFRWFEDPQSQLGTAVASVSKDGESTWLITDFSGTTLTTAKTVGATSSAKFDPYGNILSGSMSQPLQFHGQYKDSVLGLYDMRQRDYNPVTGMFLATDPITVPVGDPFISRYSYGFNNPLVFSDASGLEPRAWKDGRIVGVPGVGGISAAVAKVATKAAAKSQTAGPNANPGGPNPTPSALPSVATCTTAAECEAVVCSAGSAGSGGNGFFDSIGTGLSSAWHSTTSAISSAWDSTTSAASSAWNDTTEWWNDSVVPWWKEHGDEVLLAVSIVGGALCIVASGGTATALCVAGGIALTAVTIVDGVENRGMSTRRAVGLAIVTVFTLGFGGMAANAELTLAERAFFGTVTQGVPSALMS